MAITETAYGVTYKYHIHRANWRVLQKTKVYVKPFYKDKVYGSDGRAITLQPSSKNFIISEYKSNIKEQDLAWYYIPAYKGWVPWKTSNKQVLRRQGELMFCELEKKSVSEDKEKSNKTEKNPTATKISKIMDQTDPSGDIFKEYLRSKTTLKEDGMLWTDKFDRLQGVNPYNAVSSTREYVFFTKPDLHIFQPGTDKLNPELGGDHFWLEMVSKYNRIAKQLQLSSNSNAMPFMPILSNAIASSIDMPSITGETTETSQTIYGTTIQYRQGSLKSDESFDFSIDFYDNKWLEIYHMFKMYSEYETLKSLGVITPPMYNSGGSSKTAALNKYIVNKILHDQIGIYKIVVEEDLETILYYSYFCGCFPKNAPRDSFRDVEAGMIKHSIDWHAQFVEDMNPMILLDFNELCGQFINPNSDKMVPLWSLQYQQIDGNWLSCPYIYLVKDTTRPTGYCYKLKWFNKK